MRRGGRRRGEKKNLCCACVSAGPVFFTCCHCIKSDRNADLTFVAPLQNVPKYYCKIVFSPSAFFPAIRGKRKRSVMLRHTSEATGYCALSYQRSLYVYVIYGSSETGGKSLFTLCCQGDERFCLYYVRLSPCDKYYQCSTSIFFFKVNLHFLKE